MQVWMWWVVALIVLFFFWPLLGAGILFVLAALSWLLKWLCIGLVWVLESHLGGWMWVFDCCEKTCVGRAIGKVISSRFD